MADTVPKAPHAKELQFVGPYELHERLGRGGMAEAYVGVKPGPGGFRMPVCVKVILPDSAGDAAFVDSFLDEASIHAHLSHPNIVKVLDFGQEPGAEGRYYLALELIQGVDLRKLAHALDRQNRRLPVEFVAGIGFLLAGALKSAHGLMIEGVHQNLVHRDISPANVLLSLQGDVKLSDFGVVKAKSRITRTETGFAKGKGRYMAPEQIQSSQIDGRADLFSLGVLLFELYAGRNPFRVRDDDPEIAMVQRILNNVRPKLIDVAPHVPESHCAVVEQLLEHGADQRVQSAHQLMTMLAPLVPGPTWTSELGDYVRAVREGTPLPESAIRVRHDSGRVQSDVVTVTRTEVVRRERQDPPSQEVRDVAPSGRVTGAAKIDTARPRDLKRWARWMVPLVAVAVAGVLALRSGTSERPATARPDAKVVAEAPAAPSSGGPPKTSLPRPAPEPRAASAPTNPPSDPQTTAGGDDEQGADGLGTQAMDSPAASALAPSSTTKPAPSRRPSSTPDEENSKPVASTEKNAWLDVRVRPADRSWQVWVDGQYYGPADTKVKVTPGRHTVEVGAQRPTVKRVARVPAHGTREVIFEL